jgi:hypothetical protein
MKVTGYKLREAIRRAVTRRDILDRQFKESLWAFEDKSELGPPSKVAKEFAAADEAVARLEEAQQIYNSKVMLNVQGQRMSLAQAVKRVGGAGRLEKMWKSAALDTGRDRYDSMRRTRSKDDIHATRQVSVQEALKHQQEAASFLSDLRAAVAEGNTTALEIEIDSSLL